VRFTKWWQSLAISFSVATWGLAQPLYTIITGNAVFARGTGPALLLVILVYQAAPTAILFLLDRAILRLWGAKGGLRAYRTALYTVATLIFLRGLQGYYASQVSFLPERVKYGIMVALFLGVIGLAVYAYRAATRLFTYLAIASIILTGVFVYQVNLFGTAWTSPMPQAGPSQASRRDAKDPVFIIIFDALGRHPLSDGGKIDQGRLPNFAALARDGVLFTDATSNFQASSFSIPTLLTGRLASQNEMFGPRSLLTSLADADYTVDIYDEWALCPEDNQFICQDKRFLLRTSPFLLVHEIGAVLSDSLIPAFISKHFPPPLPRHVYSATLWDAFMTSVSEAESPGRAYYVHILLPHNPYEYDRNGQWRPRVLREAAQVEAAYEEQVMYVDSLLGKLLDKLRVEGLHKRSSIVVTGDHGPRTLGLLRSRLPNELSDLIPSVALIIRSPGLAPGISQVEYQHIDFKPTMLDVLRLPPDKDAMGVSAFTTPRPDRSRIFYSSGRAYAYDQQSGWWKLTSSSALSPKQGDDTPDDQRSRK